MTWLGGLRRYLLLVAVANLAWEIAQLPLYTIWTEGSVRQIAFAVLHCTAGDMLIASASLLGALLLLGSAGWSADRYTMRRRGSAWAPLWRDFSIAKTA
jgi:hypothetical protein